MRVHGAGRRSCGPHRGSAIGFARNGVPDAQNLLLPIPEYCRTYPLLPFLTRTSVQPISQSERKPLRQAHMFSIYVWLVGMLIVLAVPVLIAAAFRYALRKGRPQPETGELPLPETELSRGWVSTRF